MKKLKKGLSLLLVFAMIFSFASTAFAANTDWTDYSASTAKTDKAYEAVQVMTGLGIIDGVSDNTLSPNGNFTRAQAAKIISYMLLGTEAGEALGKKTVAESARKFSDYTYNTIWAVPYVEYCAEAGIVEGYEDGNFYPNRVLSSTEWLKMLVAALRYDANKLNGKDWKKYTYDAAIAYGVITAEEFDLKFDRETAILYAFNALTSEAWTKYSMATSRYDLQEKIVYDEYARPTKRVILSDGKDIVTFDIEATNVTADGTAEAKGNTYLVVDGQLQTSGKFGGNSATVYEYSTYAYSTDNATAHKYVYGEKHGNPTTIVINTYVDKLTSANFVGAKFTDLLLTKPDTAVAAMKAIDGTGYQVGDVVAYTVGNNYWVGKDNESVAFATKMAGQAVTVTNRNVEKKTVNFDDGAATSLAKYAEGSMTAATLTVDDLQPSAKLVVYIDNYGHVLYAEDKEPTAGDFEYVYVIATATKKTQVEGETLFDEVYNVQAQAQILTLDGTKKTVNLAYGQVGKANFYLLDKYGLTDTLIANGFDYDAAQPGFAKLYDMGNDTYAIESVDSISVTLIKGDPKIETGDKYLVARADTTFTDITYKGVYEDINVETVTGFKNFKKEAPGDAVAAALVLGYDGEPVDVTDQPIEPDVAKIYTVRPYTAESQTLYGRFIAKGDESLAEGATYEFVMSDGTKKTLTYSDFNVDSANAAQALDILVKGTVYAITYVDGKIASVNAEIETVTGCVDMVNLNDDYYIRLVGDGGAAVGDDGLYIYAGAVAAVDKTNAVATLKENSVVNGHDVAGSNVTLYLVNDKIVFVEVNG